SGISHMLDRNMCMCPHATVRITSCLITPPPPPPIRPPRCRPAHPNRCCYCNAKVPMIRLFGPVMFSMTLSFLLLYNLGTRNDTRSRTLNSFHSSYLSELPV